MPAATLTAEVAHAVAPSRPGMTTAVAVGHHAAAAGLVAGPAAEVAVAVDLVHRSTIWSWLCWAWHPRPPIGRHHEGTAVEATDDMDGEAVPVVTAAGPVHGHGRDRALTHVLALAPDRARAMVTIVTPAAAAPRSGCAMSMGVFPNGGGLKSRLSTGVYSLFFLCHF